MSQQSHLVGYSKADVLDIRYEGTRKLFSHPTHLAGDLLNKLQLALSQSNHLSSQESGDLFDEGVECNFLELASSQWQSGRIRVCLEFVPYQEESLEESIESPLEETPSTEEESLEESIEPESSGELSLDEIQLAIAEELIEPESSFEFPLEEIQPTLNGAILVDS